MQMSIQGDKLFRILRPIPDKAALKLTSGNQDEARREMDEGFPL